MRYRLIALCVSLVCAATAAPTHAAVSVSIGINVPVYPQMAVVPGYPVYYAPGLGANFFFYDGMYWVLEGDNWYMSSWYNGPWAFVEPVYVPYYVLRVPVRYYMAPPPYFRGWQPAAPPRWGNHWGPQWEQRSRGWDHWDRRAMPGPAPLPSYQRRYSGDRYPSPEQQSNLQTRNYRYQPRSEVTRQLAQQQQVERRGPAIAPQRSEMEPPSMQRAPQGEPQHRQDRSMPPQQEPRREGQPEQRAPQMGPQMGQQQEPRRDDRPQREAGPRMQPQPMPPQQAPMAAPNASQYPQQGRGEQQDRGRGRGHGNEGKDKRDEDRPPGK
jgi:hypothetical protein